MSKSKVEVTGGLNVLDLLGVAFVVLRLCGVINWSWWLVLLPFWGLPALVLAIASVMLVVALFSMAASSRIWR